MHFLEGRDVPIAAARVRANRRAVFGVQIRRASFSMQRSADPASAPVSAEFTLRKRRSLFGIATFKTGRRLSPQIARPFGGNAITSSLASHLWEKIFHS